eukprot:1157380-Pelagomonas_calceolata.AAC.6
MASGMCVCACVQVLCDVRAMPRMQYNCGVHGDCQPKATGKRTRASSKHKTHAFTTEKLQESGYSPSHPPPWPAGPAPAAAPAQPGCLPWHEIPGPQCGWRWHQTGPESKAFVASLRPNRRPDQTKDMQICRQHCA